MMPSPSRHFGLEGLKLGNTNGRKQVGQSIVVANLGMFVMDRRFARLGGQLASPCYRPEVSRNKRAATASCDNFVTIEREHRKVALSPHWRASIARTECFSCVLK